MPHLQLCRHRLVQGSVQNGSPGVKLPRADDGFVMALQERGPAQARLTGLGVPASPGAPTGRDMAAGTAAQWNAGEAIGVGHGGHGWAGGGQHAHPHCRTGGHGCSQVEPRPHGARRYRTAMMLRFCVGDPLVLFNTRHSSVRWSAVRSCALVSGPQPARHAWQPDPAAAGSWLPGTRCTTGSSMHDHGSTQHALLCPADGGAWFALRVGTGNPRPSSPFRDWSADGISDAPPACIVSAQTRKCVTAHRFHTPR